MKAAQDMMSKMSPEDMQNMMKMQQEMMKNPAMMQQAQQMMANPAMQQQAAAQMKNMSADDFKRNINQAQSQMPAMAAAATPAPAQTAADKLKASAMAVPADLIAPVEEAEAAKAAGNGLFKGAKYSAAATKYEEGAGLIDGVLGKDALSGSDKKAVVELKEACQLNLANCKLKLEDWQGAADECSKVLERGNNRKARFRRGEALHKLGRLDDARTDLEMAVKMDPNDQVVVGKLKAVKAALGVESDDEEEVEEVDTSRKGGSSGGGASSSAPPMPNPMANPMMNKSPEELDAMLDHITPEQMAAQADMVSHLSPEPLQVTGRLADGNPHPH